jgi:hypothetical protein
MATMEKKRKSTTLRLTEQDIQAILKIRQTTGIASDNQAIVFAIHSTANQMGKEDTTKRIAHRPTVEE